RGWYCSGILRCFSGEPELALKHFSEYSRLNPYDRCPTYMVGIGIALLLCRRFEEAAVKFQTVLQEVSAFTPTYRLLAACYAHLGRLEQGRNVLAGLRLLTPTVFADFSRFRRPQHRELILSGLQMALGGAE